MAPREELLVILDLTSTVLRAGVGVHDLIRGPLLELPTRIGRKRSTAGTKVEDYLVGHHLTEAEREPPSSSSSTEPQFDVVHPLKVDPQTGFEVTDWVGLEAIFRYALHTALQLARPPLAHPTVLSVPPTLTRSTLDHLHRVVFERLLVPSLLLSSRPFFAAGAAGVTSGLVVDLGWRGEGTEISVVHENQVVESAGGMRIPSVDEGVLDDYAAVKIWAESKAELEDAFRQARDGKDVSQGDMLEGVRRIVGELKNRDLIGFESQHFKHGSSNGTAGGAGIGPGGTGVDGDEGTFDVAKVVAEGKVSELVKKKGSKPPASTSSLPEGDYVSIPNPFSPPPPAPSLDLSVPVPELPPHATLSIGPARHAYLEPLFFPHVLAETLSSRNDSAREIGLTYFDEVGNLNQAGVQEAVGAVLSAIQDRETRAAVAENIVVISSGRVASNRALGATLIPLLSPFSIPAVEDPLEPQSAGAQPTMRYARTPEYFSNFKEHAGDWGVYLGECILGKLLIGDQQSKLFMSKAEYASTGPAAYRLLDAIP
ncbi:hypothetical protein JCM10212_005967 [Sporobolomyces blumeae]